MDARQREVTADVVNHALLQAQPAPPWHSPRRQPLRPPSSSSRLVSCLLCTTAAGAPAQPVASNGNAVSLPEDTPGLLQDAKAGGVQSVLECILRQLLASHNALLESNGGFGAPFRLADYLRPSQPGRQPTQQPEPPPPQQASLLPTLGRKWHQQ